MDIFSGLLDTAPRKSPKDAAKKPRRPRAGKRPAAPSRRGPQKELTAAEVVREALIRG